MIVLLPDNLINQIAAGEVIENPSSVIKELIENSLDAGSSKIEIEIKAGGMLFIRVSDDGVGMGRIDLQKSLLRHATSKIRDWEDLQTLSTMGFRGEALASIASISKIRIESAFRGEANVLSADGGENISIDSSSRVKGTQVEVRSLFFNVPVRKKFQKRPAQLAAEITKTVNNLALANPLVGFVYISEGKKIFDTKPFKGNSFKESFEARTRAILSDKILSYMHWIDYKEGQLHLQGYVADPVLARKNRTGQYLFLNRRPIFSQSISQAVKEGYGTRIGERDHPVFLLNLSIEPSLIDINVHPQKKYVRLQDDFELKRLLQKAVSFSFSKKTLSPSSVEKFNFFSENLTAARFSIPKKRYIDYAEDFEKYRQQTLFSSIEYGEDRDKEYSFVILVLLSHFCLIKEPASAGWKESDGKGVLSPEEGILAVDLKAATAALFFNEAVESFRGDEKKVERQGLNIPLVLDFMPADISLLEKNLENFSKLGFDLRIIGGSSVAVDTLPAFFKKEELSDYIFAILEELALYNQNKSGLSFLEKKLAQKICKVAKSRNSNYTIEEAKKLLEALFSLSDPFFGPLGENIIIRIDKADLFRLFSTKGQMPCRP